MMKPIRKAAVLAALILFALSLSPGWAARFEVIVDADGKYWFQDEKGNKFLSMGINHIDAADHEPPPGSIYYNAQEQIFDGSLEAWRESTFGILRDAGFNTIGAWSDPALNDGSMLETPILYVVGFEQERVLTGFYDDFESIAAARMEEALAGVNREGILGLFLDNEMAWFGISPWDDNPRYTILEHAFSLPRGHRGREAALGFLQKTYPSAEAFCQAWEIEPVSWAALDETRLRMGMNDAAMKDREEFIAKAAELFYSRAAAVVREKMPGVLILGTRFAGNAPDGVIEACGKHCDVISFNNYRGRPTADERLLARYWLLGKKPLMITEYSWRGEINASGNPNTGGAGSVVKTQKDRGEAYESFVPDNLKYPMVIGLHWFEWADQSPQGRFDGENSNYGVVNIFHDPYEVVLESMANVNPRAEEIHRESDRQIPTEMPKAPPVRFEPGQFPDRPPQANFLGAGTIKGPESFQADDASITLHPSPNGLRAVFNTGMTWGGGIFFSGPESMALSDAREGAVDVDGYQFLVLDAEMPEPIEFQMIVDEAGVDAPGATYDTRGGDDAESFTLPLTIGKPGRQQYRFDLSELEPRSAWGNQEGARRVDLQAILGMAMLVPSGQGEKEMTIYSLRMEK